jgi:Putative peptidoglycan binding domain
MEPRLPDRRGGDPPPDDWLAEEGGVDWSGEESEPRRERETARAEAVPDAGGGLARYDPRNLSVVQRRRAIALVVLVGLLLVAVALGVALLGDDDEPAATTTAPAVTPPPATTAPTTTAPAAEPLTVTLPESGALALGATGEEVETLQTALAALELDPGAVDGDFGAATDEAVRAFQQANDLPVDGIVGEATVERLNEVLAAEGITG